MPIISSLLATALAVAPLASNTGANQVLPTRFEAGHIYATPETSDGQQLKLLVDTGGGGDVGLYWIKKTAARRLQLQTSTCPLDNGHVLVAKLPSYQLNHGLPPPLPGPCGHVLLVHQATDFDGDGQLGASYFPGRVWIFDYPAQRLSLAGSLWRPSPSTHATSLGFALNAKGQQETGMARLTIHVDGKALDMLLDTGASAYPTASAARISGTPTVNGEGVTSYITTSMLERWHKAHPDWRVVENADDKVAAMPLKRIIEVPNVEIAGWSVGPVWFTEQPDAAFHQYMAQMMDKPTEGAVGGNVFSHFVMTIDYPHSTAYFQCGQGCSTTTPPPAP